MQFLYQLPFLESRPAASASAASAPDPFFVHITPDGIPIEDASTADFRRKEANRYSSETLRIRMARKVLAAYGLGPPVDPSELSDIPVGTCVEWCGAMCRLSVN